MRLRPRGERGWTLAEFVMASGIFAVLATALAMMYASSQKTMSASLQFLKASDQVGETTRGVEKWLAVAGMGAPTVYPAGLPFVLDATILQATSTAVTFLSEVDKDATFLVADVPVPTAPKTLPVTSIAGFQDGDTVLIFDRFFTAGLTISGAPVPSTITLSANVTLSLQERSQVSRPRRVTLSVVNDTDTTVGTSVVKGWNTGNKMILRQVKDIADAAFLDSGAFGHGIASATFTYFDKTGTNISGAVATAAGRANIREIDVNIVWPAGVQMPDRFKLGGLYQVTVRVRPWNLKLDRAN